MYIFAYFYKILMILGFKLYIVTGYEPKFAAIDIKDSDGKSIQIQNSLNCYAQYYTDVRCSNSDQYVAPIVFLYGIKPMTFKVEHNCAQSNALPKECCEPKSNDCLFETTKDIIQVWKICGYTDHCESLIGGQDYISESRNKKKCAKEFVKEGGISTSQYSYLRYACLPRKMEVNFDGGNGKGKALLLKAIDDVPYITGIKLQCTIKSNKGVTVKYVDLRLCIDYTEVCDQTLSAGAYGQVNKGSRFGLEEWFKHPSSSKVILTFTRQSPTTKYHILLYVTSNDESSDIEIHCDQSLPISTTTTTTTAAPTTTNTTTAAPPTTTTTTGTSSTRPDKGESETTMSLSMSTNLHTEKPTNSPGETEKSEDQKLEEQLIKYGEIAVAAVASIILASCICYCRYNHIRNKQKIDDNRPIRLDPVEYSKYPRLGPVGEASQPSSRVTDYIESVGVSQV